MTSGLDRRDFLRQGAVVTGAALSSGMLGSGSWIRQASPKSILDLPAGESPIDTVVVMMMENRSFDHYLGWLASDLTYLDNGRRTFGRRFAVNGDQTQSYLDPQGKRVPTYYLPEKEGELNPYRGCEHTDPGHGWDEGRVQRDHGFLAEDSGSDELALGYLRADDLPFYADMARRFTVFDRLHCSILGPTYPNREYLHSAQSGGIKTNELPIADAGYEWTTIWDKLIAADVPSGYYFTDLPVTALWGERLIPITHHIERYFADCATGTLPNVTFVDPGFTTGFRTDDHPYADIRAGQRAVRNIFKAFSSSPQWERGVFLLTYDEWGGFFDHVAPPRLPDDRASKDDAEDFAQAGFRVPALMASPFAAKGFVDHRLYDQTSILRFIQWRFLGAPPEGPAGADWFLNKRDRYARNIGASLRPDHPDPEVEVDAYSVPVTSMPCPGEELEGTGIPPSPVPAPSPEMHAFEQALHEGFYERMGYKVDLRKPPAEVFVPPT